METYKLKQTFFGNFQAYGTPISIIIVLAYVIYNYVAFSSTFFIIYFLAIFAFALYRYFIYIKRPLEIEISGNNIKMKDIFGKVIELTFEEITDIEINRRRELYISFRETKLRGLNTFTNFDRFIDDVKKYNPNAKLWGF